MDEEGKEVRQGTAIVPGAGVVDIFSDGRCEDCPKYQVDRNNLFWGACERTGLEVREDFTCHSMTDSYLRSIAPGSQCSVMTRNNLYQEIRRRLGNPIGPRS